MSGAVTEPAAVERAERAAERMYPPGYGPSLALLALAIAPGILRRLEVTHVAVHERASASGRGGDRRRRIATTRGLRPVVLGDDLSIYRLEPITR